MTPFEIAIYAALIVIIGVLLVMLRNRQPNASADLAKSALAFGCRLRNMTSNTPIITISAA